MSSVRITDLSPHYQALVALERVQGKGVKVAPKKARRGDGMSDLEASMLGQIRMAGLPKPTTEYTFAAPRRWRFDGAWPDQFVAYEVDGGSWSSGRHVLGRGLRRGLSQVVDRRGDGVAGVAVHWGDGDGRDGAETGRAGAGNVRGHHCPPYCHRCPDIIEAARSANGPGPLTPDEEVMPCCMGTAVGGMASCCCNGPAPGCLVFGDGYAHATPEEILREQIDNAEAKLRWLERSKKRAPKLRLVKGMRG